MSDPLPSSLITCTIDRLGHRGDGIASAEGRRVFVPFTLPGETVQAAIESSDADGARARLLAIETASPERRDPPCVHFGVCGGCDLQHASDALYADFKQSLLAQALHRLGVDASVLRPLVRIGPQTRRRAEFAVAAGKEGFRIGFHARHRHDVFDLAMCPVTRPSLLAVLPAFRACLDSMPKPGRVKSLAVAELSSGLDLRVAWKGKASGVERQVLLAFASTVNPRRLALETEAGVEILFADGEATADFGGVPMEMPTGAFQQATAEGEQAILARIVHAIGDARRIADIYAGCGTYSLPLVQAGCRVAAWEGEGAMVEALTNAAIRARIDDRLIVRGRDLHRMPLTPSELKAYDAIVINPPRNGAGPQMAAIAESGVPRITVVSCNPVTFERDARLLLRGRYRLNEVTGIDQFLWSHHLELVACFERG